MLFVTEKIPVVLVALGTALALYFTGILNLGQALGGLGDASTIFIASLFVVSAGLEITGVTAWAGQLLIAKSGESRVRQLVLIMLLCSLLTALISLNGAVAALLPVVVVMAVRLKRAPSQLLMPMVFSAHAGSILALTGSPVNVLVSEAAQDAGTGGFGFFEFSIVGVPLLVGTIVILVVLGEHLLPNSGRRVDAHRPEQARAHAGRAVPAGQRRVPDARARHVALHRRDAATPSISTAYPGPEPDRAPGRRHRPPADARAALAEGDTLLVRGDADAAAVLATDKHLALAQGDAEGDATDILFNRTSGLAEVVIPPRSAMVGQKVFPGMVTESGDLIILAVQRRGEDLARRRDAVLGARRHDAAAGHVVGARQAPRRPAGAGRQLARPRAPAGGADGARREDGDRHPRRDGARAGHGHRAAP